MQFWCLSACSSLVARVTGHESRKSGPLLLLAAWLLPIVMLVPAGCTKQQELMSQLGGDSLTADAQGLPQPLLNPTGEHQASTDARVPVYDIPRFAINSPFDTEYDSPVPKEG